MLELGCARVPPVTPHALAPPGAACGRAARRVSPSSRFLSRDGNTLRRRCLARGGVARAQCPKGSSTGRADRQAPRGVPVATSTHSIPSRTAVSPAPRPAPTRSLPPPRGGGGRRSEREGHVPRQARELCRARTPRRAPCSDAADRRAGRLFTRGPERLAPRVPPNGCLCWILRPEGERDATDALGPAPPAPRRARSGDEAAAARRPHGRAPRGAPCGPGARLAASACGFGGLCRGAAHRGGGPPVEGAGPPRRPRLAPRRPPPPRPAGGAAAATHDDRSRAVRPADAPRARARREDVLPG